MTPCDQCGKPFLYIPFLDTECLCGTCKFNQDYPVGYDRFSGAKETE